MPALVPYRDFYYPLNVFMHILTREEGSVSYLHYGLFDSPDQSIAAAQERSTELVMQRLPAPPARVLEVGIGLGTTLARIRRVGYEVAGITPDDKQVEMVRSRYGTKLRVENVKFEEMTPEPFDVILFQESSQYIDSNALFAKAREMTNDVIVLDEFSVHDGTLHRLDEFLRAAKKNGFDESEHLDLSAQAAPTVDYFMHRLDRYRAALKRDLGLSDTQVDELIASGANYRDLYKRGAYVYRLLRFTKE